MKVVGNTASEFQSTTKAQVSLPIYYSRAHHGTLFIPRQREVDLSNAAQRVEGTQVSLDAIHPFKLQERTDGMTFLSAAITTDKSRVTPRDRLSSPFKRLRPTHKCTCQPHYQSPTPEQPDTFNEYREEDQFSDADDGTTHQDPDNKDEDGDMDSDWDEHATLIALLDDE
jgi:hypothetical protein